jgi:voltage-gated potassium channel
MFSESKELLLRFKIAIIFFCAVLTVGAVGFWFFEGGHRPLLDCFYFILVTITTIGYGDITPTNPLAKLWTMFVIFAGVGITVIIIPLAFESMIGRKIKEVLKVPTEERKENHAIICGYGKVGRILAKKLQNSKVDYVVIESNPERVKELVEDNIATVEGDAKREEILERAGIKKAKTLLTCLEDAENVFVIITAKMLNPKLYIIAKVEDDLNEIKLKKVGADAVVSCHDKGAQIMLEMAQSG